MSSTIERINEFCFHERGNWRVRPSTGPAANLSFGEYADKNNALEISKMVSELKSRAAAFRLRDSLGINGRGETARAQRSSLAKDRYRKNKQLRSQKV